MIRVFVGTDSDIHGDAEKVLEYSIRTNTAEEVDLTRLRKVSQQQFKFPSTPIHRTPKGFNQEPQYA